MRFGYRENRARRANQIRELFVSGPEANQPKTPHAHSGLHDVPGAVLIQGFVLCGPREKAEDMHRRPLAFVSHATLAATARDLKVESTCPKMKHETENRHTLQQGMDFKSNAVCLSCYL